MKNRLFIVEGVPCTGKTSTSEFIASILKESEKKVLHFKEDIYVFDCCFLQNPLCETMMRFNMKSREIHNYINSIYERIKALNPVVIYLKNTSIKQCVQDIAKERKNEWLEGVIEYHTSQGYGKSCGYIGFDGYVECLKVRQEIELSILNKIKIDKLIIENPFENWDVTHTTIKNFINEL